MPVDFGLPVSTDVPSGLPTPIQTVQPVVASCRQRMATLGGCLSSGRISPAMMPNLRVRMEDEGRSMDGMAEIGTDCVLRAATPLTSIN